ncbi:glycosyltransferase family 4 protein [Candidatus Saccharibacteria bacterium]|nr:glycosyltransferase family 4 protein [Candidatus Saccharibacteria bacterium]
MKIGLVCPYDIFKNGGVQESVLALRAEYEYKGHEAYIITPRPKGIVADLEHQGILLVGQSRDIKSPFHTTAQIAVTFDNAAIDELLEKFKFDVIHYHEPWVPIISRQILIKSNAVNVGTFHAKLPDTVMSRTIEKGITPYTRSILKYIDVFTAVSSAASEYISTLTDDKINIVPNGIDIKKFSGGKTKRNNKGILFIGRLEKRKGVKYLLDAFKVLQESDNEFNLTIAGDGPDRTKLEAYVHAQDISNVSFLGFIDEKTKIDLLHNTRIYCSPALYGESFGIVLLEAMAAGAVTVAGSNPGYSSVMVDKGTLSLVNVKDTQSFARKLKLLINDEDMRSLWLKWAEKYVQQFNYENIASQYLNIYKQGIKNK